MRFQSSIISSLLAIVLLSSFARLGFWQLERSDAKEKKTIAFSSAPMVNELPDKEQAKEYTRVTIQGRFLKQKDTLADNQVLNARPGIHVYSLFITNHGKEILVNRGWLPMPLDRSSLPAVETPDSELEISGFIGPMPVPGRKLGEDPEMQPDHWPQLLSYPTVSRISVALERDLYPWVLFLDSASAGGFDGRDWKPVYISTAKHRAYAFQWFALSAATLFGWLFLSFRKQSK